MFYYTHDGSDVLSDTLQLTVEDGVQSVPVTVQVTVVKVDKAAPVLDTQATMTLTLPEGDYTITVVQRVDSISLLN